mmetsp:Transcript_14964/g.26906  ORF Transcript_14964/g.26906 Transcript_14964/m.26906 type:complete len:252 (-) Transcript_14964:548-1303(-)|eukprot:CAMPEP_0197538398 /NCGR_PEP_ID=MMETSP1318-20131121/59624_1 /TAXON_ID=552666 /ORGANISM="Partenskyella glossopodia, Strain RCC365" /LENGTH=251 /DNA_ID=CAMNT_0043096799 /DNA_START=271 /DNA_END=1026 /DNA_ORIENTATION=-
MSEPPQTVVVALFIVAATTYFIFRYYRTKENGDVGDESWPFPILRPHGLFNHTRAEKSSLDECKSDFCRIAWTMTDLLVTTPEAPIPEVWKYPGFGKKEDSAHKEVSETMFQHLEDWLQKEIKQVGGALSKGLGSRVVDLLSVSPAVTFAMEHKIPLQILQSKYMVAVSKKAEVRVIWFAFITDKVKVGAKSGPFVLKLLSTNLNEDQSEPMLSYTATRTKETQMCAVTAQATDAIRTAILDDDWDTLELL